MAPELPRPVLLALEVCVALEQDAQERVPWGTLTGTVVGFKQRFGDPDLGYVTTTLASPPGTYKGGALLREVMRSRAPQPFAGAHLGSAFLAEGLDVADELVARLVDEPALLDEQFHDLTATGQARQFRIVLGVMTSGWRFIVQRHRHGDGLVITVSEPGSALPEDTDKDFVAAVTELNAHVATF